MSALKTCPQCGNSLPGNTVRGLCPKCLALLVFPRNTGEAIPFQASLAEAPQPALQPKLNYIGDYQLLEEIARGGMGVVFKAMQVSLNRVVAVKMILSGQMAGEVEIKRFRTEAEAAANLQHPNIVAIHEVGQHESRHYFSMEYVEGPNLANFVKDNSLSPTKTAELLKTVAEAVHYAHQRGTLHRDLKPHNVLMDANGQPHITDFGLAKRIDQDSGLTQTGAVMGSPAYMSPEQAAGRQDQVGPQSDVYSLGAILYQLLTGKPPFAGAAPVETIRQVIDLEPVAPSKVNSSVPPDLETICLKCLEKRAERRYHSARDLAEELGRFLDQEPILAKPASGWRRASSWLRRHPWAITGAATLAILGLAGFAYGLGEKIEYLQSNQTARSELSDQAVALMLVIFVLAAVVPVALRRLHKRGDCAARSLAGLVLFVLGLFWEKQLICGHVWDKMHAQKLVAGGDFVSIDTARQLDFMFASQSLMATLVCWAGIHQAWKALRQHQMRMRGSDAATATDTMPPFLINGAGLIAMLGIVFGGFWGVIRFVPIERFLTHGQAFVHVLDRRPFVDFLRDATLAVAMGALLIPSLLAAVWIRLTARLGIGFLVGLSMVYCMLVFAFASFVPSVLAAFALAAGLLAGVLVLNTAKVREFEGKDLLRAKSEMGFFPFILGFGKKNVERLLPLFLIEFAVCLLAGRLFLNDERQFQVILLWTPSFCLLLIALREQKRRSLLLNLLMSATWTAGGTLISVYSPSRMLFAGWLASAAAGLTLLAFDWVSLRRGERRR